MSDAPVTHPLIDKVAEATIHVGTGNELPIVVKNFIQSMVARRAPNLTAGDMERIVAESIYAWMVLDGNPIVVVRLDKVEMMDHVRAISAVDTTPMVEQLLLSVSRNEGSEFVNRAVGRVIIESTMMVMARFGCFVYNPRDEALIRGRPRGSDAPWLVGSVGRNYSIPMQNATKVLSITVSRLKSVLDTEAEVFCGMQLVIGTDEAVILSYANHALTERELMAADDMLVDLIHTYKVLPTSSKIGPIHASLSQLPIRIDNLLDKEPLS